MGLFVRSDRQENELKWAHIWFKQFAIFHKQRAEPSWKFSADDVISFSRHKRDSGMPGRKRKAMVEGLIAYRCLVQNVAADDLQPIRRKLTEIAALERARADGVEDIEEIAGKINPQEPDIIQQLRRKLRLQGK